MTAPVSEAAARGIVGKGISYIRQASVPLPDRLMSCNLPNWIMSTSLLSREFLAAVDLCAPLEPLREIYSVPAPHGCKMVVVSPATDGERTDFDSLPDSFATYLAQRC